MKTIYAALLAVLCTPAFAGYELNVPPIHFEFRTSDGAPVEGVGLAINTIIDQVSMTDSSFIPLPSLPHWGVETIDVSLLGHTDINGELRVPARRYSSSAPYKRRARAHVFSNAFIMACGDSVPLDLPVNAYCSVEFTRSSVQQYALQCKTTWDSKTFQAALAEKRKSCR